MTRLPLFVAGLVLGTAAGAIVAAAEAPAILPLAQVTRGMVGVGRTVFAGDAVEEFGVEVLGVLTNTAPHRSTILAMLRGGPLAETGVIAGMSGSPVYVDGKLIGAVSSGYLFSKQPIAGITPIEEMLEISSRNWDAAAGSATSQGIDSDQLRIRLSRLETGGADLLQAVDAGPLGGGLDRSGVLPIVLSGFDARAFQRAAPWFAAHGLTPMQGAGVARSSTGGGDLGPGSPVAVEFIRGDLDIAAFGTVTTRVGDDVLAFGHPLFSVGTVDLPMAAADVVTVLPSVTNSFKISGLGRTLGALRQDRAAGVLGKIGAVAPMVPLALRLHRDGTPIESFSFELASHRLITPVLVQLAVLNTLLATEKLVGDASLSLTGSIRVAGQDDIVLDHFFSGDGAATAAGGMVAAIVQILLDNPFAPTKVESVDLGLEYVERSRLARIEAVRVDRQRVRAGDEVGLQVDLIAHGGGRERIAASVRVPAGIPPGPMELVVGDSSSVSRFEARSENQTPRDLRQLIRYINELRKGSSLFVLLSRPDSGIDIAGHKHTRLPPSAYMLLARPDRGQTLLPVRRVTLVEVQAASAYDINGFQTVNLIVEPATR